MLGVVHEKIAFPVLCSLLDKQGNSNSNERFGKSYLKLVSRTKNLPLIFGDKKSGIAYPTNRHSSDVCGGSFPHKARALIQGFDYFYWFHRVRLYSVSDWWIFLSRFAPNPVSIATLLRRLTNFGQVSCWGTPTL